MGWLPAVRFIPMMKDYDELPDTVVTLCAIGPLE